MKRMSIFGKGNKTDDTVEGSSNARTQQRPTYRSAEPDPDSESNNNASVSSSDHSDHQTTTHHAHDDQNRIIESSAGTNRLNRILKQSTQPGGGGFKQQQQNKHLGGGGVGKGSKFEKVNVNDNGAVMEFVGKHLPHLKIHPTSIGGNLLDSYPASILQEVLYMDTLEDFETSGTTETIPMSLLQYPMEYNVYKRNLHAGYKTRTQKIKYIVLARSTNRPTRSATRQRQVEQLQSQGNNDSTMENNNNSSVPNNKEQSSDLSTTQGGGQQDYEHMYSPEEDDLSGKLSLSDTESASSNPPMYASMSKKKSSQTSNNNNTIDLQQEEEISSFPVILLLTLHADGTCPDIRKLLSLETLTTIQDLHASVLQLAFENGDTMRLDFGESSLERPLNKERFSWNLFQVHAMLCNSVVERHSTNFLPPLNVYNLDRSELQYIATINKFRNDEAVAELLHRQTSYMERAPSDGNDDQDVLSYDLLMGNFASRVNLFYSDEERKDAQEILNAESFTNLVLDNTDSYALAEKLSFLLQSRMRDLEAETCRRLIAWEDEKSGRAKLFEEFDSRDTVDAIALGSLFKTLESLDSELEAMENWLQDRAAAIKPLTDDCADIEEENRQLEQKWKSYEMLSSELRRLLHGHEIDENTEAILKNPASVLVYDEDGLVDVDESEDGIDRIYEAGKALLDAIEFPRKSGAIHLRAVSDRAKGHTNISNTYCSSLAQIIVTVMEQFKTEVVAGSDYGKVSKNDTHTMISKKIRDTQRKFQSSLLNYIRFIEILAHLSPEMLPALRESYAELVSEGILMKKRLKGYFQALPGKNAAYMNVNYKNLKDYVPFDDTVIEETVNAPDIRAVLSELLPVIAREAYFTSALFGSASRDQDGREKKRNFENAKNAVDKASTHFRYYVHRSCGITETTSEEGGPRSDPLLCLVSTVYLNEAMDNYIDREKKGGDHSLSLAYVRATILDLRKKADKQWVAWVDQQIEWIKSNDGVPLTGKRAGIFPSFARFPAYLDHVILCCKEGREESYMPDLPGIKIVNYYMQKMAVTMLDSLKEFAGSETTDQQYASQVMLMENTYFFTESIKARGEMITKMLHKQISKANSICKDSTDSYLGWMIKREFTALHELFSKISKLRKEFGDRDVEKHVPRHQFVRTLNKEASRDVLKERIGTMYGRMEKHLCEEGNLLPVAWKALVKVLYEWFGRWEKLCMSIYKHKLDPGPVDVVRLAKAAGGEAKPKNVQNDFGFKNILALGNKQQQPGL